MDASPGPRVRPRTSGDVPELIELLATQQPTSRYPLRWPLPFPVEEFVVRRGQWAAWVAEDETRLLGHVAVGEPEGVVAEQLRAALEPIRPDRFGSLSVLFVDPEAQGMGVGRLLHDTAVAWIRASGRHPVLDVVPSNRRALQMYEHLGWCDIGPVRPAWLPDTEPDVRVMTLPQRRPSDAEGRLRSSVHPWGGSGQDRPHDPPGR